jgi:eukaryotic-like serine/threonine-protein kinase
MNPLPNGLAFAKRYEITRCLGQGGFAIVYEARDRNTTHTIALKVLRPEHAQEVDLRARFERETQVLKRLGGPHLRPVLDSGIWDSESHGSLLYLTMALAPGRTLDATVPRPGGLPDTATVDLTLQICAGVRYAHERGVIHRDLNPENTMVDDAGRVVLLDFGLSKIVESETNITAHGTVVGSLGYMSPEQARGDAVDSRTDVYGIGALMFFMMNARAPYEADSLGEAMRRLLSDPVPRVARESERPALAAVVAHALAKETKDRYPTAAALAEAVRRASASPKDVQAVHPAHFGTGAAEADGNSATMPDLPHVARVPVKAVIRTDGTPSAPAPSNQTASASQGGGPSRVRAAAIWGVWIVLALGAVALGIALALRS